MIAPTDPRHGKPTGYQAGCREDCCSEVGRRRHKLYLLRARRMGGSTTVDASRAAEVIVELRQRMSYSAIARAIDTSHNYITKIERGGIQRISPEREAAILALRGYRPTDKSHVSSLGAQRRLRALYAMGYSYVALSEETGYGNSCTKTLMSDKAWAVIEAHNDRAIREAYDRLSMRIPTSDTKNGRGAITYAKNKARRLGWLPPLAWDDIDDPNERPSLGAAHTPSSDIDEAVVLRLLAGERMSCTTGERHEAMRRWKARGGVERTFCLMHGWKDARYGRDVA